MDLVDSTTSMDSYLTQLREDSIKHEKIRLRVARTQQTRINKSLEAAARKITVEPPLQTQKTKSWHCKEVDTEKRKVVICKQEPTETREGSLVVQKRIGIVVVCDKCTHRFTHYSKDIGKQYFCCCSRCHANIRLKHYK
jgi:hypothetical protein